MIDSNYLLVGNPYVSKKTGTSVKHYRNKTNPNITVKEVSVGPNANRAKITKSWLFKNNNQAEKLVLRDLSLGANHEQLFSKLEKGWKLVKSSLKPL